MGKYVIDCCELFHCMTGLPVVYYNESNHMEAIFPLCLGRVNTDFFYGLCTQNKNPSTYISESQGVYGKILLQMGGAIVVGPAYSVPITDDIIRSYLHEIGCPTKNWDVIKAVLNQTERMDYQKFARYLTFLYWSLTREKVNLSEHYNFQDINKSRDISVLQTRETSEAKENGIRHNTYDYEQKLFALIREGDTRKLLEFMVRNNTVNMYRGDLSENPLRNAQNRFVMAVTKVGALSALPGKLDTETTYQLIDSYIRECDRAKSVAEIERLEYIMVMDFCQRIGANRAPRGISQEIYTCMNYIREKTNERITVSDVAQHIGRSQSYLNVHFRNETGITVSNYIMQCKLEEAARLLEFSEQTLAEISCYLNFSSQSYFQNLFKREYGITPMQYRKNYHQS